MLALFTKISVAPNQIGYLYKANVFEEKLEAGVYSFFDFYKEITCFKLPITSKSFANYNQEILTKDGIAFRFSYTVQYKIIDGQKFLAKFELNKTIEQIIAEGEMYLSTITQVHVRKLIANFTAEEINEKRNELVDLLTDDLQKLAEEYGVKFDFVMMRDITFPKNIQDLFAKLLESKIRAKADLENARTTVAAARTLKNASEIMKDDDNMRFFQFIEAITKIASMGKHTFMIGDMNMMNKEKK